MINTTANKQVYVLNVKQYKRILIRNFLMVKEEFMMRQNATILLPGTGSREANFWSRHASDFHLRPCL